MKSAKLSKNELIDLIFYSLNENNVDIKNINRSEIESIFADYIMFCNHFQIAYVQGELDTFKRAACLLVSINRGRLSKDKKTNASIALDAAYKMCEKPYWNVGENFNIPKKLEEVEFKKAFEMAFFISLSHLYCNHLFKKYLLKREPNINYLFLLIFFYLIYFIII